VPELPEVEAARRLARRVAVGRRIVGVWCAPDPIVYERVAPARVRRALLGRRVTGVGRHGKHFWLELDRRPWPCFHFGMAGGLHAPADPGVRLVSHGARGPGAAWPPRFTKLALDLGNGRALAMADGRRLGRIRLRHEPRAEPPISLLGFDALDALPTPARFHALLGARGAPVKAVLLDQGFAAGVGNWIADEVLYQARIAPRRRASTLSPVEAGRIRAAIRLVVGTAVRVGSDGDRFPKSWLFHRRWGKQAGAFDIRGRAIRHDQVGGRTTAWVPAVQR
jgi:formamidopyrimidine-DNA glycosylase